MSKRDFSSLTIDDIQAVERQTNRHGGLPLVSINKGQRPHIYISQPAADLMDLRKPKTTAAYAVSQQGVMIHRVSEMDNTVRRGGGNIIKHSFALNRPSNRSLGYSGSGSPLLRAGLRAGDYYLDGPHHIGGIDYFAMIPADEYLDPDNGYIE